MNTDQLISSGLLESYVLGTCTPEEAALVQSLCEKHPELLREIEAIEAGLMNYSAQMASPLNPALKNKIAAQLSFREEKPAGAKIIPVSSATLGLYKFGIAASLLLFVSSVFYTIILQQKVSRLHGELAELSASKSYMAEEMQVQQASMNAAQEQLQVLSNPKVKKVALTGMNSLVSRSAAILWDTDTKVVYFNAGSLPVPPGKQYQLWAIVNGKPVDAGLIESDGASVFQKMSVIPEAQAFAVTIENKGGSSAPSLETMCLLGNV